MVQSTSIICRIVVITSNLQRLTKILSLLQQPLSNHDDDDDIDDDDDDNVPICLQYLPCVAHIAQYRDERTNEWISYLANVEYHPELNTSSSASSSSCCDDVKLPTTLLELVDDTRSHKTDKDSNFPILADIVLGNGIDNEASMKQIRTYFETLLMMPKESIPIHHMTPTLPYTTMADELQAFQALTVEEKEVVTQKETMGPGKMVSLIQSVSQRRIREWRDLIEQEKEKQLLIEEEEKQRLQQQQEMQKQQVEEDEELHIIDANKVRYACRICRNILFGQDDLLEHTSSTTKNCESYFLHQSLPWMKPNVVIDNSNTTNLDNDLRETLGRLICTKCRTKVGTWNWSGTPCSCGEWVVPAFQFPKSKVDAIPPVTATNPNVTIPIILPQVVTTSSKA